LCNIIVALAVGRGAVDDCNEGISKVDDIHQLYDLILLVEAIKLVDDESLLEAALEEVAVESSVKDEVDPVLDETAGLQEGLDYWIILEGLRKFEGLQLEEEE
jgi:hypothetical protein